MEEHVDTMVHEMKKKNKLLQGLMLKQDAGALASSDMDQNKVCDQFDFYFHFSPLLIDPLLCKHAMMRKKSDEVNIMYYGMGVKK